MCAGLEESLLSGGPNSSKYGRLMLSVQRVGAAGKKLEARDGSGQNTKTALRASVLGVVCLPSIWYDWWEGGPPSLESS